jgi:hypothetical protein
MIRVMGCDLKPARSGIAMNYDPDTGGPALTVAAVGKSLVPLHDQVRIAERAVLIRCNVIKPDVAFIEATFSKGRHSDYGQIAVHFAVTHILWSLGVPVVNVSTGKVKMWATGSGSQRGASKVTKVMVVQAILARYGRVMHIPPHDDECDAVSLMSMGAAAYGAPIDGVWAGDMPKAYSRALDGVDLPPVLLDRR